MVLRTYQQEKYLILKMNFKINTSLHTLRGLNVLLGTMHNYKMKTLR
jgi:hypothetical protein